MGFGVPGRVIFSDMGVSCVNVGMDDAGEEVVEFLLQARRDLLGDTRAKGCWVGGNVGQDPAEGCFPLDVVVWGLSPYQVHVAKIKVGGRTRVRVVFGLVLAKAFFRGEDAVRALGADMEAHFLADGHVRQVDVAAVCMLEMTDQ